jgi:hypothetical protein
MSALGAARWSTSSPFSLLSFFLPRFSTFAMRPGGLLYGFFQLFVGRIKDNLPACQPRAVLAHKNAPSLT